MKAVLYCYKQILTFSQIVGEDLNDDVIKCNMRLLFETEESIPYKIIDMDNLPIIYPFFNAYRGNNNFLTSDNPADYLEVDYEVAKNIWRRKMREARDAVFPSLDIKYMRALESGDTVLIQSIVEQKNALRDAPDLALPDDLEGIKQVWPEILGPKPI